MRLQVGKTSINFNVFKVFRKCCDHFERYGLLFIKKTINALDICQWVNKLMKYLRKLISMMLFV